MKKIRVTAVALLMFVLVGMAANPATTHAATKPSNCPYCLSSIRSTISQSGIICYRNGTGCRAVVPYKYYCTNGHSFLYCSAGHLQ